MLYLDCMHAFMIMGLDRTYHVHQFISLLHFVH